MPLLPVREKNLSDFTFFAATPDMQVETAFAAMGDMFVQAWALCFAPDTLDAGYRIAGGTVVWIGRTYTVYVFRAVFIFPAIHACPPF